MTCRIRKQAQTYPLNPQLCVAKVGRVAATDIQRSGASPRKNYSLGPEWITGTPTPHHQVAERRQGEGRAGGGGKRKARRRVAIKSARKYSRHRRLLLLERVGGSFPCCLAPGRPVPGVQRRRGVMMPCWLRRRHIGERQEKNWMSANPPALSPAVHLRRHRRRRRREHDQTVFVLPGAQSRDVCAPGSTITP